MKKHYLVALMAIMVGLCAQSFGQAQKKAKDKILAGKVYKVEFNEQGGKKPMSMPDEISFKGEKLNSKVTAGQLKFPPASYTATVDSSANPVVAEFKAESMNPDKETLKWEGTVEGDQLEAKVTIITAKGKTKREFTVSGTMKPKPIKKVAPKPVEEPVESEEPPAEETPAEDPQ